jgi:hypothetical protein
MIAKRQKLYLVMTSKLRTIEKRHTIAIEQEVGADGGGGMLRTRDIVLD